MASLRMLAFDHEGRPQQFDTWLDDLQLYLLSDSRDSVSLFDHTSGAAPAPPDTTDSATRSQTAQALYVNVVARYSLPATAALGRLLLPYLFPELSTFATVDDLVSHLRASDARYRAATPTEFINRNQHPMFITLYFIVTRLPDSLRSVRDHFLSLDPTSLTVDLLEQHLLVAETSAVAVGAACGTPRTPFFEGCSPSPLAPSYASAAAVDVLSTEDGGAASTSVKRRSSKGKGGRGGGGGRRSGGGGSGGGGSGGSGGGSGGVGGGDGGSAGSGGSGRGGSGGGRTGAQRGGSGGGQRQRQQRQRETPSPQQLREWLFQRGASGGSVSCPYVICTGDRAGQTCRKAHTQHRCFSCLDDAWRAEFGDEVERPHWAEMLKSGVAIFDLDYDPMYALSASAEGDCYRCVPPDHGIEVADLGAGESSLPGTAPAEALHTFTLHSSASRCFFRDNTTLTPLPSPGPVRLADPSGGPVVARSSTFLPCPAVPSGSLSGLHLPSFSTNLVSTAALQDAMVTTTTPGGQRVSICTCTRTGRHLATFTRRPRSSLYTLATEPPQIAASAQVSVSSQGMHSRLLVSSLPRSLPPLPPSPAPPCLPCGRERYFLLVVDDYTRFTVFPLRSKGQIVDVLIPWIRTVRLQLRERFHQDLAILRLHSDRGGEFSSDLLRDFCRGEGILQSFTIPDSPQQNGIAERRIGLVMEVALSLPETSPILRWTGKVGDASVVRVWGSRASIRDTSADKLSTRAIPCIFLGFVPDAPGWHFYHTTLRRVLPSQDVTFDESVPFCRLFPYGPAPPPPPPQFLAPGPPQVDPFPPQGPAPSGVSQVDPLLGAEPGGVELEGVDPGGAESEGAESRGTEPRGVEPRGGELEGAESGAPGAGGAGDTGAGGTAITTGAGGTGDTAATGLGGAGAAGTGGVGCAGAGDPTEPVLDVPSSIGLPTPFLCPPPDQSQPSLQPASPLPAPSPYTEQSGGLIERREPASCPVSPVRTARRAPRSRPPPVPGMHTMALHPSSVPLRVPLPAPPESSLPEVPDPASDRARAACPTVARLLATVVTDPCFESAAASALVTELLDFAAACRLDYTTALVAESESARPPSVGGECALGTDVLEDKQEEFECLAAAVPRFASLLLALEGDLDAPDIPTPRSYAEAITGPYSSQWQASMVKRPPGSPPAFKARYVARGTQWSLCRPVYSLRQAPHEWQETLRTTLAALGFAPSTADPSLFLRTDTSLPPFYVLVYVDDLVVATADTEALTLVKSEVQKRHKKLTWVLQRFGFQFSSPQPTPLSTNHSLSDPPLDESVEPSGPYPELVGCLMHQKVHWDAAERVLRYLCITSSMGLVLGGRGPVFLAGHANASWSTRSSSVLSSSCEAEIYAGAMAAQELHWLTYLLTDLGEQPHSPPVLYVDNKAMIALCQEHRLEHRMKHIALRYFLAQELQQRGQLHLAYVASRANTAHIFTKALPPGDHQRFSSVLRLTCSLLDFACTVIYIYTCMLTLARLALLFLTSLTTPPSLTPRPLPIASVSRPRRTLATSPSPSPLRPHFLPSPSCLSPLPPVPLSSRPRSVLTPPVASPSLFQSPPRRLPSPPCPLPHRLLVTSPCRAPLNTPRTIVRAARTHALKQMHACTHARAATRTELAVSEHQQSTPPPAH
ncbi:unnamed protein product [Closterium sp. NIES-53]